MSLITAVVPSQHASLHLYGCSIYQQSQLLYNSQSHPLKLLNVSYITPCWEIACQVTRLPSVVYSHLRWPFFTRRTC
jgi:hypothetical protein